MKQPVSDRQLKQAHTAIAKIIVEYGDQYLPIFERLDQELKKRDKHNALLQKAFSVASDDFEA